MQDSLNILCHYDSNTDYIEHHGVKGMKWGVRRQRKSIDKLHKRAEKKARDIERMSYQTINNLKNKSLHNINKYEKKQYKLAKPYADASGHFKITSPKKAQKHYLLSEKIMNEKKLIKQYEEVLKNGRKKVNKNFSNTSMSYIHSLAAQQAHQNAVQQHMNFMNQVSQQNTLQSIQNFHNQMHFNDMINLQNIHTHNMMF